MLAHLNGTDWGALARAVHIVAVVVWIGGVWLVTTALLPAMRGKPPVEWLREFEALEHRFAPQARIAVLLVLLSGLYMLDRYGLWDRFGRPQYWWMDLMVGVWVLFTLMLFVVEPFVFRRVLRKRAMRAPDATLARMLWLHRILLALAVLTVFAAAGGSHGLF